MKSNKTDDLFRRGLKNLKQEPSAEVWDKLAANLHGKKRIIYWKWAGIAASLLVFGMAATFLIVNNESAHTVVHMEELETMGPETEMNEIPLPSDDNIHETGAVDIAINEELVESQVLPEDNYNPLEQLAGITNNQSADIQPIQEKMDDDTLKNEPKTESLVMIALTQEEVVSDENNSSVGSEQAPVLAESNSNAMDEEKNVPIRIVYKKGKDGSLLASNDNNIVKKSFKKIGEITEDMKFSEERKARWRKTKDNILAFNIDQIFDNTNEEESEEIEP